MRRTATAVLVLVGLLGAVGVIPAGAAAPAPAEGQKLPPPTRRDLLASQNNLKQIVLAMHNYHDTFGRFPNNVYTKDGKGLLSWRVLILPFVEENELYKQFKLDEPWDGETNKKLVEQIPKVYAPVRVKAKAGMTYYRGFAGKGAPFGPDNAKGLKITAIVDGTSNTGLLFEAGEPVIWTQPDDLPFDPAKALPKLGGLFDGQCQVGMADGSVRRLRKDPDEKELKKLIGYNDGEVIDFDKLDAK